MLHKKFGRGLLTLGTAAACVLALGTSAIAAPASRGLNRDTRFYTPQPNQGAVSQIVDLAKKHDFRDAALLAQMAGTPQAKWFTSGTPADVRTGVRTVVTDAARRHTVPVLVAYDIPFRDCSQYSAGGAVNAADYAAWIDGFARGIGGQKAVVLLEPDSIGIIPFNTDINGNKEWCQPQDSAGNPQPGASPADRYAELNAAVDRLERQPNVAVYLDGTHSGWLGVGDASDRLVKAGVRRAQGFFLNVSNYQATPRLQKYGTWISDCIALGTYSSCASQYYPASPNDFSTWTLTDQWYAQHLGSTVPTTHFVVDTSRNGQGPNDMSGYAKPPFNQPAAVVSSLASSNWCNPPGAGLGLRPTAKTGVPLLDAYLWVKIPGESDGSCDIAGNGRAWDFTAYNPWGLTGDAQNHFDPLWGLVDPAAGQWFPQQALQLAQLANPPLR